jgi:hypothetical protein
MAQVRAGVRAGHIPKEDEQQRQAPDYEHQREQRQPYQQALPESPGLSVSRFA